MHHADLLNTVSNWPLRNYPFQGDGGTPSFAKIIYGNGSSKSNVENDILNAIRASYKEKKKRMEI